jgi:hypothetical protein
MHAADSRGLLAALNVTIITVWTFETSVNAVGLFGWAI